MTRLQERVDFWDEHHYAACQGGTPVLIDRHLDLLRNKDVLEIGPGEGRQFSLAAPVARSYAVADISQKVLSQPLFSTASQHQLTSWRVELGRQWDIIHAWYVVHHLLPEERPEFFNFLRTHLKHDGTVIFNIPFANISPGDAMDDGMRTTRVDSDEIISETSIAGLRVVSVDLKQATLLASPSDANTARVTLS